MKAPMEVAYHGKVVEASMEAVIAFSTPNTSRTFPRKLHVEASTTSMETSTTFTGAPAASMEVNPDVLEVCMEETVKTSMKVMEACMEMCKCAWKLPSTSTKITNNGP